MKLAREFVATWCRLGWIVYLALGGVLVSNIVLGPFMGAGNVMFSWVLFGLILIAAVLASILYRRLK